MSGLLRFTRADAPELESFAQGVERDKAAVQAGLTLAINNGQVEGQVTRIKLIKRMMYGKAGFALLRQRVLHRI
jgi:transposase